MIKAYARLCLERHLEPLHLPSELIPFERHVIHELAEAGPEPPQPRCRPESAHCKLKLIDTVLVLASTKTLAMGSEVPAMPQRRRAGAQAHLTRAALATPTKRCHRDHGPQSELHITLKEPTSTPWYPPVTSPMATPRWFHTRGGGRRRRPATTQ